METETIGLLLLVLLLSVAPVELAVLAVSVEAAAAICSNDSTTPTSATTARYSSTVSAVLLLATAGTSAAAATTAAATRRTAAGWVDRDLRNPVRHVRRHLEEATLGGLPRWHEPGVQWLLLMEWLGNG
uniref:Uncharacterized protein n=1 Tax=Anopheles atroparvus TaxID=41427 RepID=A0A182JAK7_ANOAO